MQFEPLWTILLKPRTELELISVNASSGWNTASFVPTSKREGQSEVTGSFENELEGNNTIHKQNVTDAARVYNTDKASEFPVPRMHFDKKSYIHHRVELLVQKAAVFARTSIITSLKPQFCQKTSDDLKSFPFPEKVFQNVNLQISLKILVWLVQQKIDCLNGSEKLLRNKSMQELDIQNKEKEETCNI